MNLILQAIKAMFRGVNCRIQQSTTVLAKKIAIAQSTANTASRKASSARSAASEAQSAANEAMTTAQGKMSATDPVATGSFSMGRKENTTVGTDSHAEGVSTTASGYCSHAECGYTTASGYCSHAEGYDTTASGSCSHAEGASTTASDSYSHAEGYDTTASGHSSHAEGTSTTACGDFSHAEGASTTASGQYSHAEGFGTTTIGHYSHAEGLRTTASAYSSHAQGCYNIADEEKKYAHIVGNGTNSDRSNAHTLDWSGNATFAGTVTGTGADYAEYFEWSDGNPDSEDRVGSIVTLDGEKIRLANAGDEILGVVSGTAMVLGDNAEWEWRQKYLVDDYGRVITEMVEEFHEETNPETGEVTKISLGFFPHRKLNPDFDPERTYERRCDRKEWETIGLLGKVHVTDNGTCAVGGYATVADGGIATASAEKTNMRVMKRITDSIVLVLLK